MGNPLCVYVHAGNIHDTRAEYILLKKLYIVIPHLVAFVPIKDTGVLLEPVFTSICARLFGKFCRRLR